MIDHPVSRFATATPPKEGNGPPQIPLLRRGGGVAAGVVFFSVCGKVIDHPVSRFATATLPKEGNGATPSVAAEVASQQLGAQDS